MATRKTPVDPRVEGMTDLVLTCRMRHDWDESQAELTRFRYSKDGVDTLEERTPCARDCGCVQIRETVTFSGSSAWEPGDLFRKTAIDYSKAKNYLNPLEGTGRIERSMVRRERARRLLKLTNLPIVKRG
jgi:hypothetical protein